jgi:hypothetical protein
MQSVRSISGCIGGRSGVVGGRFGDNNSDRAEIRCSEERPRMSHVEDPVVFEPDDEIRADVCLQNLAADSCLCFRVFELNVEYLLLSRHE